MNTQNNPEKKFTVFNGGSSSESNYYLGSKHQHDLIIELEEKLLCALILDSTGKYYQTISSIVTPDDFFTSSNKKIFEGLIFVRESKKTNSLIELTDWLVNEKCYSAIGGQSKIEKILSFAPAVGNIRKVSEVLLTKSMRRKLEIEAKSMESDIKSNFSKDPEDILKDVENRINKLKKEIEAKKLINKKSSSWKNLAIEFATDLSERWDGTKKVESYKTGLFDLDEAVGGFQPGDFIMLAGPSGIGKTIFGCALVYMFASQDVPCLFLSGEMPEKQIIGRIKSCITGIDSKLLTRHEDRLTQQQLEYVFHCTNDTADYPIAIKAVTPGIKEIETAIQEAEQDAIDNKMKNFDEHFKIVIVDYLQLLAGENNNDNPSTKIDELAKWCKIYAQQNNAVVISFAQINDSVLDRPVGSRIPTIKDVGWCRTAKNHADTLAFLWSDYFNNIVGTPQQQNGIKDQEILELHFVKSRHTGFYGMVPLIITRSQSRINSLPSSMHKQP